MSIWCLIVQGMYLEYTILLVDSCFFIDTYIFLIYL